MLFISCEKKLYKFSNDKNGEPIVKEQMYTFNKIMNENDYNVIDTSKFYVQIFDINSSNETERENPNIIKFHSDGYFKLESKLFFGKYDRIRFKNSVGYGGKFYLEKDKIYLEKFYPSKGGKTQYFVKLISDCLIKGDTLFVDNKEKKEVYVKRNKI